MLRVVLPCIACAPTGRKSRRSISPTKVAAITSARDGIRGSVPDIAAVPPADIRVAIEIVVAIDVDVVPPHRHPHPQPPLQNAPIIAPMPKESATPAT